MSKVTVNVEYLLKRPSFVSGCLGGLISSIVYWSKDTFALPYYVTATSKVISTIDNDLSFCTEDLSRTVFATKTDYKNQVEFMLGIFHNKKVKTQ